MRNKTRRRFAAFFSLFAFLPFVFLFCRISAAQMPFLQIDGKHRFHLFPQFGINRRQSLCYVFMS